ncbi:unnamed protein product [Ambrosiozyma monospora]|uniref:Unnamed protein product n=1 Tax=Ambrosiozyma monospora TaxID=43982 RepID=A0ACB5T911_AMBMO|nr:unnamed protein product [Ambrosiozyma monospora]
MDSYDTCCPDKLSFDHFKNLNTLEFDCLNQSGSFNLSILPNTLEALNFTTSNSFVLGGNFPSRLRTLNMNLLSSYAESLSNVFKKVSNLTRLDTLRIQIPHYLSVDFRDIDFPVHLCLLELWFRGTDVDDSNPNQVGATYLVFDSFPSSSGSFILAQFQHTTIVIDDSKGESIDSMRRKLSLLEKSDSSWIQYTTIQEETSIFDSLKTLFD